MNFDPEKLILRYESNFTLHELEYGAAFKVNDQVVDVHYKRYESPYATGKKKDPTITFTFQGESLFLDFEQMIREYKSPIH